MTLIPATYICRAMLCAVQGVDLLMLRTLGDMDDAAPSEDPLVVLPGCGHAFTTSTLDGHMALHEVYKAAADGAGGCAGLFASCRANVPPS